MCVVDATQLPVAWKHEQRQRGDLLHGSPRHDAGRTRAQPAPRARPSVRPGARPAGWGNARTDRTGTTRPRPFPSWRGSRNPLEHSPALQAGPIRPGRAYSVEEDDQQREQHDLRRSNAGENARASKQQQACPGVRRAHHVGEDVRARHVQSVGGWTMNWYTNHPTAAAAASRPPATTRSIGRRPRCGLSVEYLAWSVRGRCGLIVRVGQ